MVMKLLQINLIAYGKQYLYNRQARNALYIECLFKEHSLTILNVVNEMRIYLMLFVCEICLALL